MNINFSKSYHYKINERVIVWNAILYLMYFISYDNDAIFYQKNIKSCKSFL